MKVERAIRMLHDVANQFGLYDRMQYELEHLNGNEEAIMQMGMRLGLSERDLQNGSSPVPDALYKRYSLFTHFADWKLCEELVGPYAPYRTLQSIFGEKYQGPNVPSSAEEKEAIAVSVRSRCDQKILQINELFPDTYPLHLPVWKFRISTSEFLSFEKVYELADSWDDAVRRFSALFFAAVEAELPESDALELNLLASFFDAVDLVMPQERITYSHIQKYRAQMQEEGFKQFGSYVKIRMEIPFWKAREFYSDLDFLARYIAHHDGAKAAIRSFLARILAYECHYTFINNVEEHEYRQSLTEEELEEYEIDSMMSGEDDISPTYIIPESVLIEKTDKEITQKDRLIAEHGKKLVQSIRNGGVTPTPNREYSNLTARRMNRMGIDLGLPKHYINPLPSHEDIDCDEFTEEGACNEEY